MNNWLFKFSCLQNISTLNMYIHVFLNLSQIYDSLNLIAALINEIKTKLMYAFCLRNIFNHLLDNVS